MTTKAEFLARLGGQGQGDPLYVPDLTLWHGTHRDRGDLPGRWRDASLPEIAADLGVVAWTPVRPWRIETPGVEVERTETASERITRWTTAAGALADRWTLGPDGSWWQVEYPVKSADDLKAAVALVRARSYVIDGAAAARLAGLVPEAGVVAALENPTRPFSDLLYDLVGLTEGPMMLMMGYPEVAEIIQILEEKLAAFAPELARLTADVVYSPDNLDRQFLAPALFDEYMADSYRRTVEALGSRPLVVHAGGPVRQLLAPLAACGVAAVEGVCGPPQSDAGLTQAREAAGPGLTLWGGIPQDALLATHDRAAFEAAVAAAAAEARGDGRMVLGVADRVPADAEIERLEAIGGLLEA
ncbi:MAG: uroporphyrinogen decarboxylase family protein [Gemmatimonadota bacterium]